MKQFHSSLLFGLLFCLLGKLQVQGCDLPNLTDYAYPSDRQQPLLEDSIPAFTALATTLGGYCAYNLAKRIKRHLPRCCRSSDLLDDAPQQDGTLEQKHEPTPEQNPAAPIAGTGKIVAQQQILLDIHETIKLLPLPEPLATQDGDEAYGYMEAHVLPDDSRIAAIGDLHGDKVSLDTDLKNMRQGQGLIDDKNTLAPQTHLLFTGDLTDRGQAGTEVWRTIMQLIKTNRDCVHVIRGNHEAKDMAKAFGFYKELQVQFGAGADQVMDAFEELFKHLPFLKILGMKNPQTNKIEYTMYLHGGLEKRLTPQIKQLLAQATKEGHARIPFTAQCFKTKTLKTCLCALHWGDFCAAIHQRPFEAVSDRAPGQGVFVHNKAFVTQYLRQFDTDSFSVTGLVRGHQHIAGGVAQLNDQQIAGNSFTPLTHMQHYPIQQGSVFSLTSSPGGLGMPCREDAFAVVENTPQGPQLTPYIWQRY
jgi:calcineurin-like phosphoesterase family protein